MLIYYEFFCAAGIETLQVTERRTGAKGGYGVLVVRIDGEAGEVDGVLVVLAPGRIADASTPHVALLRQRQGRRLRLFRAHGCGVQVHDVLRRQARASSNEGIIL